MRRAFAILAVATAVPACQNKPDEPAPRVSEARAAESAVPAPQPREEPPRIAAPNVAPSASPSATPSAASSAPPGQEPSQEELARLPYPPFPGARVKRFLRQPSWARKGAYTLSVEGAAKRDDVSAFYMQRIHKVDAASQAEEVLPTYVRIRSTPASVTIDVTVSKDGKTVGAQIGYGMF